ncbi:mobile mystery protein A [Brevundimonas sp.]|jgi:predicted DNA-binding mobile mystery protein A|uniref:mobile mystery protein A n=1 Tax=Brevundimonas sp. TaxID=1871086 RepID=UPI0017D6AA5C|nr:mobile mystery protein A [Brevundimonas sp.]MBA4809269.1 mobile mystery protein A [Brevundimonas sp.]
MVKRSEVQALGRKHLDRQFEAISLKGVARPPKGWLRAIRDALGLTSRQLASRMGKTHTTITALEKGEIAGTTTLNSLRAAAEAMNCTLVYAIIPNQPLEDMVRIQSRKLAEAQLMRVNHTMRLEDQAVARSELAEQIDRLAEDLRRDGSRLWDEA